MSPDTVATESAKHIDCGPAIAQTAEHNGGHSRLRGHLAEFLRLILPFWWLFCLAFGLNGILWGYSQWDNYWRWHFGEFAWQKEASLLLLCIVTSFLVRRLLFRAGDRTRNLKVFWRILLGLLALPVGLLTFLFATGASYRYLPWQYYPLWALGLGPVAAATFEVFYAIYVSYKQDRLLVGLDALSSPRKLRLGLEELQEQINADTNALVWMLGLLAFFLTGFYSDVFLLPSQILIALTLVALVLVIAAPWIRSRARIQGLISEAKDQNGCWAADANLGILVSGLDKFDFKNWLLARRKDVLPDTALHVIAPYMNSSLMMTLLKKVL